MFLPFTDVGEEMRQIPLVGLGNFSARWNVHGRVSHKGHKGHKGHWNFSAVILSLLCQMLDRRMARDFVHRFRQQLFPRWNFMPGRSARGMGQRNKIEDVFGATSAKLAADHLL